MNKLSPSTVQELEEAIQSAIQDDRIPGAVLTVVHDGEVAYQTALGNRRLEPESEPMTLDTIFDCASLTKVVVTASLLMRPFEQGRFGLNDFVTDWFPTFQGGESTIRIRDLLTHFSGLRADVDLVPRWSGHDHGICLALADRPEALPGQKHIYSDINFEILGELIAKLEGKPLDEVVQERLFGPLKMVDSGFNPAPNLRPRIAPTERDPDTGIPFWGVVHDPTARYMGGVAGHAGLFSTASDLARFAQMILNGGELEGVRIVSELTVAKFTSPHTPHHQPVMRGLGWDIDSPYSTCRGALFPIGSFGHTGFTGTMLWIDPTSKTAVILLTNSVHPTLRPPIIKLRSQISTIVAAGIGIRSQRVSLVGYHDHHAHELARTPIARNGQTLTGLDVLLGKNFAQLRGQRIGLITNHTGRAKDGQRNIELFLKAGVDLTCLFSPEHGFAGKVDDLEVPDDVDSATGLPIRSLYGPRLAPDADELEKLDTVVFDIQDIGARFYTYASTMVHAMRAALDEGKNFVVLDRPNPINGLNVEGPLLDPELISFIGTVPGTPVRHGLTLGEFARFAAAELEMARTPEVIKMEDWQRGDWFDATGLPWINPSPNLRSLTAATLYPGLCFLEYLPNLSVGRGTDAPFEQIGALLIDGIKLAKRLNQRRISGVRCYPVEFCPRESRLTNEVLSGVRFTVSDRNVFSPTRLGLEIASALSELYPGEFELDLCNKLIGSRAISKQLMAGVDPITIEASYASEVRSFSQRSQGFWLYDFNS